MYPNGKIELDRSETELQFSPGDIQNIDDKKYVPISDHLAELGYDVTYDLVRGKVDFLNNDGGKYLPKAYDMREHDRVTPVRNQGAYGTCWAFASLGALESISLPMEENIYSVDHMSMNNGFSLDLSEGGEHTMSLAYLASWEGPVYEADDEYGDGETDPDLTAVFCRKCTDLIIICLHKILGTGIIIKALRELSYERFILHNTAVVIAKLKIAFPAEIISCIGKTSAYITENIFCKAFFGLFVISF